MGKAMLLYQNTRKEKAVLTANNHSCFCVLKESLFTARVVYDLLFYFIVIIIVLNLIFGVIIDTFADLRSEKQKKEEVLKTTCFICGRCLKRIFVQDKEKCARDHMHDNSNFLYYTD